MLTGYTASSYSFSDKSCQRFGYSVSLARGNSARNHHWADYPALVTLVPEPSKILLVGCLKVREVRDHKRVTGMGVAP